MNSLAMFLLGVLFCFLTITTIVGISYSAAVVLGRGLGMCQGVLLVTKIFFKNRAAKTKGAQLTQATNSVSRAMPELEEVYRAAMHDLGASDLTYRERIMVEGIYKFIARHFGQYR